MSFPSYTLKTLRLNSYKTINVMHTLVNCQHYHVLVDSMKIRSWFLSLVFSTIYISIYIAFSYGVHSFFFLWQECIKYVSIVIIPFILAIKSFHHFHHHILMKIPSVWFTLISILTCLNQLMLNQSENLICQQTEKCN